MKVKCGETYREIVKNAKCNSSVPYNEKPCSMASVGAGRQAGLPGYYSALTAARIERRQPTNHGNATKARTDEESGMGLLRILMRDTLCNAPPFQQKKTELV